MSRKREVPDLHSIDAERAVLAGLLLEPTRLSAVCAEMSATDLWARAHEIIFRGMQHLAAHGEPIDTVTLRAWLVEREQLARVGGDAYLLDLTNRVPPVVNITHHARIVHEKAMQRRAADALRAAQAAIAAGETDVALAALAEAQTHAGGLVRRPLVETMTLRELGVDLDKAPPDPRWCWTRTDPDDHLEIGVVERGTVGMLVGWPGVGKSTLTLAAAISVACGIDWLGWHPAETGRVLFLTAEETIEHVRRRLYQAVHGVRLTLKQRDLLLDNLVPVSLRGESVALVHGESTGYAPTSFSLALREHIASRPHALVIVDPLSRFSGPDTETSNAAGTAFVRELEALTRAPSEPTVLFSHHTRKGADLASMEAARGSSSLSGGVKWQANIKRVENERGTAWGVAIKATKSNYAPDPPHVNMRWDGSVLRIASAAERRANDAAVERAERAKGGREVN